MKRKLLVVVLGLGLVSFTVPTIELVRKTLLDDKIEILVPKDFGVMSEELMNLKYPSNNRPTLVFTDETGGINVGFNHTPTRANQQQIAGYKDDVVSSFKNLYPSAEWKGTGVKEINGKKVAYLELITPAMDTKVYNLMFFTDVDGRLLICTFNCVEKKHKDWIEPAQQIMNSLKVNE